MIFKKIKANPEFAQKFKKISVWTGSILVGFYLFFLFILPFSVNINAFTPKISEQVKEQTGLDFELINPKLQTTLKLGIKLKADKIALKYEDKSDFLNLTEPSIEINLPTLFLKKLNLDKIYAKEAKLSLVFTNERKYTIEKYITKILKNDSNDEAKDEKLPIDIRNINILVEKASLSLKDEIVNKTYVIKAQNSNIQLASLNGPIKIKTQGYIAEINSDNHFNDFNINLYAKLPSADTSANHKDKKSGEFKFDFDPFYGLDMFNLQSKLTMDLKILDMSENFKAKGYFNLENLSIRANGSQLPDSYIKAVFDSNKLNLDSRAYLSKEEYLITKTILNFGKKSKIDLSAKTDKITLNSAKNLLLSILNMLSVKNDLANVSAQGYMTCDFNLKSNFKTIQSDGILKLIDGSIKYPKSNLTLTQISSYLDFDGNTIKIKDTNALINGAKFDVSGTVQSDSKLDIKIFSDPLKIADIIKLVSEMHFIKPSDIKDYTFNGGTILISVIAKGELKNIIPKANIEINNAAMTVKSLKMPITLQKAIILAEPDKKDFTAKITAQNFKAKMNNPIFNISADNCEITANSKTLTLKPFNLNTQGSITKLSGTIEDYTSKPSIELKAQGNLQPSTILAFVPKNNRKYVSSKGQMPFSANIEGLLDNLKVQAAINSNAQNYISVVDIKNIRGLNNTLNADMSIKGDDLIINGIHITSKGTKIASISGRLNKIYSQNPKLSPINFVIPQKLQIALPAFGNITLESDANLSITGSALHPQISGNANVSRFSYPQFKTSVSNLFLDFKKSLLTLRADGIKVAGSDFAGDVAVSTDFSKKIIINDISFVSSYVDSDALIKLMSSMPNTQTTAGPSLNMIIKNGRGKISKLKSGTLIAQNVSFDFNLYNNLFKISNINAIFSEGKITADATYNIANTKVTIDGIGKSIDMRKAASAFGINSLILSGTMNGMAKLSLRGTTYQQQIRTLNGQVKFDISNGQYGEAARFERFLHAGNLLTQNVLNFNLNQTLSAVKNKNTGEFKKMEGTLSISNGWANITSFESTGPNMSLYAEGKYGILTENADLKVLGRISSTIVSVLGPLGSFSINKIMDKIPEKGIAILEAVKSISPTNSLFAQIKQSDLAKIPPLSVVSANSTSKDFQVLINGPVSKASSVKSFKWASKESPSAAVQN